MKIKYNFTQKSYIRNSVIYKQDDLPGKVYIVMSGEFQESCQIALNKCMEDNEFLPRLSEEIRKINSFRRNNEPKQNKFPHNHLRTVYVFNI